MRAVRARVLLAVHGQYSCARPRASTTHPGARREAYVDTSVRVCYSNSAMVRVFSRGGDEQTEGPLDAALVSCGP
jgi:hypothetical protein